MLFLISHHLEPENAPLKIKLNAITRLTVQDMTAGEKNVVKIFTVVCGTSIPNRRVPHKIYFRGKILV